METNFDVNSIGIVRADKGNFRIELSEKYIDSIFNIDGFSHLQILWWGHLTENSEERKELVLEKPYKKGPDKIGVFATRSPIRPNPILLTNIYVQNIDFEKGIIYTPYIDAEDGTPVLDIKPYNKTERIKNCSVPQWCSHWPEFYEDAATFNWGKEFNF